MIHPNKILIHHEILRKIKDDVNTWKPKGLESGGYIPGKIHMPNLVFEAMDFIDGGPNAKRTHCSFSGDNEYATKKLMEAKGKDSEIRLLAEYHLHPWNGIAHPSQGDFEQIKEVKNGKRPWYFIMLASNTGYAFWDLNKEGTDFVEIPHQVLRLPQHVKISSEKLMDRIHKIIHHEVLAPKTVTIVGIGSGGSVIAKYLAVTGIGRIILVDNDLLELENVIRHEGSVEDIGKPKTEICKRIIESHNPFTLVETYQIDALEEKEKLTELIARSDLVISSSGNSKVNNVVNEIALEKMVPVVFGGIFERAKGGYILPVLAQKTPCLNCLFSLTSQSYHVDKDAAEAYNIPEEELHAQQGLWMDISIPTLIATKVALMILQGNTEFLENYNVLLYKNPFDIQRIRLKRREDCFVCNFEGWRRRTEQTIENPRIVKEDREKSEGSTSRKPFHIPFER